jgi:acetylornithine deacetylase/succinyl-diaminopimelate desuccinylase-like protein
MKGAIIYNSTDMRSAIDQYVASAQAEFEDKLKEWVEIPTISAEPEHKSDIERGAAAAVKYLRSLGANAESISTPGNPVVIGKFTRGADYPTVTVYNHLDVQPANEPQWKRAPFVFHKDGNKYIGRGSTDDKGPALTALFGARYAIEQGTPINIQFIWELEEEIGSPNFEHFLKVKAHSIPTDSIVVSDTIWIARGKPAVAYGLRGLAPVRLVLKTGTKDVHSGLTGGAARNPITELCQLIGECYDVRKGIVKIPGFYDDVANLSKAELKSFLASGFSVREFKRAHELRKMRDGYAADIVSRLWARPTFEVHGIAGGYTGPGVKTAIPYQAEAKISMRLVPNQKPEKILKLVRNFIKQRISDVQFIPESCLSPYLGPHSGPHADAARDAMRTAFGKDPAFVREGGSIGAVVTMEKYLKAPIVFLGLSLPEHGYHAPNENFDWEQASGGMKMFARYFENLSKMRS